MSDHKLLVTPWSNTACTFQTLNTENKLGNSRYTITKNQVQRYAPGNQAPIEIAAKLIIKARVRCYTSLARI